MYLPKPLSAHSKTKLNAQRTAVKRAIRIMHLTLTAPDLLPPAQFIAPQDLPTLPALEALLARARITRTAGRAHEVAVLNNFGLTQSAPIAALTALADTAKHGVDTWVRADPVHLAVSRDNVQLMDSHVLEPTLQEAHAIVATLNAHLKQDGLTLVVNDAARWVMQIDAADAPATTPLWAVTGGSLFDHLPHAAGKINWRALQNELQMLLHDHPVNLAREANGARAINGIWFWGAGSLNGVVAKTQYRKLAGRLALARGLAMHAGILLVPLPTTFADLTSDFDHTLVVLHTPTRELRANRRGEYVEACLRLDRDWFNPALAALATGKIAKLTLQLANEACTLEATIMPRRPLAILEISQTESARPVCLASSPAHKTPPPTTPLSPVT